MSDFHLFGVPGIGMVLVSWLAVVTWRRVSGAHFKWFWVGAALWTVAVVLKVAFALLANQAAVTFLNRILPALLFLPATGLYVGAVSAAFEIGLTWLAGRRWKFLGSDASTAIAVGIGAGALEALVLGFATMAPWIAAAAGEDTREDRETLLALARPTPLFWLEPPAGRLIALLGHVSTRALVLVGVADQRRWLVLCGFTIFALVDGTAELLRLSKVTAGRSMWWTDAATLPFNLIGIAVLVWYLRERRAISDNCFRPLG